LNDLLIMSYAELALEGALRGGNGIVMIVGTGSIAIAKAQKDKLIRCGGWGIELDDEGSGAWIGREGLTAIVRALDGRGKPTKLSGIFNDLFPTIDFERPRTIVKAYSERNLEYHMLSPSVMACAEEKDEVCLEIIHRAAFHLMELLEVLQKSFKTSSVPVALMGGVIDSKTLLADILYERINNHKKLKLVKPLGTALDGGLTIGTRLIKDMVE
jgi:N-acetylglucosamine kinase-like BadF-type ATPase